jgi:archaemetzincin
MRIAILCLGKVDPSVIGGIQENLDTIFADTRTTSITETLPIPKEAYAKTRQQYRSDIILSAIHNYAETHSSFDRTLGIVDVDLFVPRLNFIFGEAEHLGRAVVISLWRLRPEFYGRSSDNQILVERGTKEAVHELGHTLGLKHCPNPFCVMHFSNSIFETDRKQSLLCNKCYLKTMTSASKGKDIERRV